MSDRNDPDGASVVSKLSANSTVSTSGMTMTTAASTTTQQQQQQQIPPMMTGDTIVVSSNLTGGIPPPPDSHHRAVHQIRTSALSHNYGCVESAANRQRCSVIVVVKADGYGHGALATALHLADSCGADAFAVATLEEAIALRKAFVNTRWPIPMGAVPAPKGRTAAAAVDGVGVSTSIPDGTESVVMSRSEPSAANVRSRRPPFIRILVLGPPVGFPRCFDDYLYYNIECMVSGQEVAEALVEWVANADERKRTLVERAARDAKEQAMNALPFKRDTVRSSVSSVQINKEGGSDEEAKKPASAEVSAAREQFETMHVNKMPHPSATLSNVSGQDLANEVRAILMNQKIASSQPSSPYNSGRSTPAMNTVTSNGGSMHSKPNKAAAETTNGVGGKKDISASSAAAPTNTTTTTTTNAKPKVAELFGGIEAVAKDSRTRQMAASKAVFVEDEDSPTSSPTDAAAASNKPTTTTDSAASVSSTIAKAQATAKNAIRKRKLRWHALVDSGMGRLGFKTEPVASGDTTGRRDTVAILKELVDAEVHDEAPIEFYGMCTHMADANPSSDYTVAQISRFKSLLKRVRNADISVPTVSTDNSAALLTTTLTHFEPDEILSQPHFHTRGFVRCGGAIYGQRPAFTQLRAVSTLKASVRHVAVLKAGESVGYDRAYIAPYDVRIATLTIGFADGYPRELGNGVGKVAIRGVAFPVAGNVCMDMLMVELGPAEDLDGIGARVVVGDTAVLWGPETEQDGAGLVRLQDLATTLKTTQSALTCGLDKIRVPREYAP